MKALILTTRPAPDYYAVPVLSTSAIKQVRPDYIGMSAKPETLRFGQLLHLAVYEPHKLLGTPEFAAHHQGQPSSATRQINRMVQACRSNPLLNTLLGAKNVQYEQEIFSLLTVPGLDEPVPYKMKADLLQYHTTKPRNPIIAPVTRCKLGQDLKSTSARTFEEFVAACTKFDYWLQAYAYMLVTGAKEFYFTGVTKSEPHKTFTVDVSKYPAEMAAAAKVFPMLVRRYVEQNPRYVQEATQYLASLQLAA